MRLINASKTNDLTVNHTYGMVMRNMTAAVRKYYRYTDIIKERILYIYIYIFTFKSILKYYISDNNRLIHSYLILSENVRNYSLLVWWLYTDRCEAEPVNYVLWF